jgi:hypothetical protein
MHDERYAIRIATFTKKSKSPTFMHSKADYSVSYLNLNENKLNFSMVTPSNCFQEMPEAQFFAI